MKRRHVFPLLLVSSLIGIVLMWQFLNSSFVSEAISLTVVSSPSSSLRILCLILTHPANHLSQAKQVHATWGQRCDSILFITNAPPSKGAGSLEDYYGQVCDTLDPAWEELNEQMSSYYEEYCYDNSSNTRTQIEKDTYELTNSKTWKAWFNSSLPFLALQDTDIGRDGLWNKTIHGFRHAFHNLLNDFDWFLKADDDTYVIMENLHKLLYPHDPNEPIHFGCSFQKTEEEPFEYMSGGAGYVLSRGAVGSLFSFLDRPEQSEEREHSGPEDLHMGFILHKAGVRAGESRDKFGRPKFLPLSSFSLALPDEEQPDWYWELTNRSHPMGLSCCPPDTISFHYIKGAQMHLMELLLYRIKIE